MYKLDLHTHSIISHDGGIKPAQYQKLLDDKSIVIAITDHNKIAMALQLREKFGEQIIVGEEVMTNKGEIIGLFIKELIPKKLSPEETIKKIREQNGLVYIPHPFEKTRRGLPLEVLESIVNDVDIIEVFNARTLEPRKSGWANNFADKHHIIKAASSDAHSVSGFGGAFSLVSQIPTKDNLRLLLTEADFHKQSAPFLSRFAPATNKIRKIFIHDMVR